MHPYIHVYIHMCMYTYYINYEYIYIWKKGRDILFFPVNHTMFSFHVFFVDRETSTWNHALFESNRCFHRSFTTYSFLTLGWLTHQYPSSTMKSLWAAQLCGPVTFYYLQRPADFAGKKGQNYATLIYWCHGHGVAFFNETCIGLRGFETSKEYCK